MAGKIKPLPKILAGLALVGALVWGASKFIDKVPAAAPTPPAEQQVAPIAPGPVNAPVQEAPAQAAAPAPATQQPAKKDAFDALIYEAGKK